MQCGAEPAEPAERSGGRVARGGVQWWWWWRVVVVAVVVVVSSGGGGGAAAGQGNAAERGPGRARPDPAGGSRCFMYDMPRGGARAWTWDLPEDARAAGLIVALSTPFGCAEYMERSGDGIDEGHHRVCETTCLDIVGGIVRVGMENWRLARCKTTVRACQWLAAGADPWA